MRRPRKKPWNACVPRWSSCGRSSASPRNCTVAGGMNTAAGDGSGLPVIPAAGERCRAAMRRCRRGHDVQHELAAVVDRAVADACGVRAAVSCGGREDGEVLGLADLAAATDCTAVFIVTVPSLLDDHGRAHAEIGVTGHAAIRVVSPRPTASSRSPTVFVSPGWQRRGCRAQAR